MQQSLSIYRIVSLLLPFALVMTSLIPSLAVSSGRYLTTIGNPNRNIINRFGFLHSSITHTYGTSLPNNKDSQRQRHLHFTSSSNTKINSFFRPSSSFTISAASTADRQSQNSSKSAAELIADQLSQSKSTNIERVRFAPSPTGTLHVGGARTALYNYLWANKKNGAFLIRVEDTDLARSTKASEISMLKDLKWLGLTWNEGPSPNIEEENALENKDCIGNFGPYRQSERGDIYREIGKRLLAEGKAYPCFCTEEELEAKRVAAEAEGRPPQYDGTWRDADPEEVQRRLDAGEPYTVRFKVDPGKRVEIDDLVRGKVAWNADDTVGDFILLRSNGVPVYNFCVAVDDAMMGITTVIRAEEHLTNTLRQCLIMEALDIPWPKYAHCSLILGEDRSKLSKRHGATSVDQFRKQGFLPEAMWNYLALLGWNDGTEKEIYSREELIEAFSLDRIVKSPSVFDVTKLKWLNGQHLRAKPNEEIANLIASHLASEEGSNILTSSDGATSFMTKVTQVIQGSMELITDSTEQMLDILSYNFKDTTQADEAASLVGTPEALEEFKSMISLIISSYENTDLENGPILPKGNEDDFTALWKAYVKQIGKLAGKKGKHLFHPIRLALTGEMSGPDVGEQLQVIHLALEENSNIDKEKASIVSLDSRIAALKEFIA